MTDGITEPYNAEGLMYEGLGRSHKVISQLNDDLTVEEVVDSIIQDVISYMVDEEERDSDITLVAVIGDIATGFSFPIPTKSLKLVSGTIGYGVIRRLSAALSWHPFFLLLTHPI